ncbi:MAG: hypothetical protein K9J37_22825 [Saprospiraceae bacterium]|nr:hypothetical protein [Saprospiraceae bacterium]MCF8252760.1 hypothetical protein [Saprospiraceae bacterium]MCF8283132.1 hypothetical protein [Bacteroidales bacterium]MCF8314304.1 hypothetical protein [Saprospiraceae bacterium]MCF8443187.1 hypothetical protein [Saprospiraceae bacterium]
MQQLILNIEDSRYQVLLKFLSTLDYVRIVKPAQKAPTASPNEQAPVNQLALLKQVLQKQTKPLFQQITDPAAWQKQQRDEWS